VLTRKTLLTQPEPVALELDQRRRQLFYMMLRLLRRPTHLTEPDTALLAGQMAQQYLQQARDIQFLE
jgi:hypothetical protein